jgi:hypothetical protein
VTRLEHIHTLQRQLTQLWLEEKIARSELDRAVAARRAIEFRIRDLRFNCPCVRINRAIGIYTSAEHEMGGRIGLECGVVSETHSALRSCPQCNGTGEVEDSL